MLSPPQPRPPLRRSVMTSTSAHRRQIVPGGSRIFRVVSFAGRWTPRTSSPRNSGSSGIGRQERPPGAADGGMARRLQLPMAMPVFPSLSSSPATATGPVAAGRADPPGPRGGLFARLVRALLPARHAGAGPAVRSAGDGVIRSARDLDATAGASADGVPVSDFAGMSVAPPVVADGTGIADARTVVAEGSVEDLPRLPSTTRRAALLAMLRHRGLPVVPPGLRSHQQIGRPATTGEKASPVRRRGGAHFLGGPDALAVSRSLEPGLPTRAARPPALSSLQAAAAPAAGTADQRPVSRLRASVVVPAVSRGVAPAAGFPAARRPGAATPTPVPGDLPVSGKHRLPAAGRENRIADSRAASRGRGVVGGRDAGRGRALARPGVPQAAVGPPRANPVLPTKVSLPTVRHAAALTVSTVQAEKAVSGTAPEVATSPRSGNSRETSLTVDLDKVLAAKAASPDAADGRPLVSSRVLSSLPLAAGSDAPRSGQPGPAPGASSPPGVETTRIAVTDERGADVAGHTPTAVAAANRRGARAFAALRLAHLRSTRQGVNEKSSAAAESRPDATPLLRSPGGYAAREAVLSGLRQALRHIGGETPIDTPPAVNRAAAEGRVRSGSRRTVRGRVRMSDARPGSVTRSPADGGKGVDRFHGARAKETRGNPGDRAAHAVASPATSAPSGADQTADAAATRASQPLFRSVMEAAAGLKTGSSVTLRLADTPFGQLRMTVYRRGDTVHVRVVTDSGRSGAALRREEAALTRVLEARGLQLGAMRIEVAGPSSPPGAAVSNATASPDAGSSAHHQPASAGSSPGGSHGEARAATPRHRRAAPPTPPARAGSTVSTSAAASRGNALHLDLRV